MKPIRELLHFIVSECSPAKFSHPCVRTYFFLTAIVILLHLTLLQAIGNDTIEDTRIASAITDNSSPSNIALKKSLEATQLLAFASNELSCDTVETQSNQQLNSVLSECKFSLEKQLFEDLFCNEDNILRIIYISDDTTRKLDNSLIQLINKYSNNNDLIIRCENPIHDRVKQQKPIHSIQTVSEDVIDFFDIDTLQAQEHSPANNSLNSLTFFPQPPSNEYKSSFRHLKEKRNSFYASTLYSSYLKNTEQRTSENSNQNLLDPLTATSQANLK